MGPVLLPLPLGEGRGEGNVPSRRFLSIGGWLARSVWSAGACSRFLTLRTAPKRRQAGALQTLRAVEAGLHF
jgi:hypothetical protein